MRYYNIDIEVSTGDDKNEIDELIQKIGDALCGNKFTGKNTDCVRNFYIKVRPLLSPDESAAPSPNGQVTKGELET